MWHRRSQHNHSPDSTILHNAPDHPRVRQPRCFSRPFRSSSIWTSSPLHSTIGNRESSDPVGDPLLGEVQYEHEDAESTCVTEPIQDDNGSPDAYTFFNFEDDDDDGDAENDEEEEEEEKEEVVFQQVQYKAYRPEYSTIYYAYRVPGDGGSSSDDSSTLASQRSDRSFTQSSSSSISGRHQHPEKAARILGLDQESLRSFRTFPSSYSTDNYNFGFRQKNTSTDLLKPSDAALASYLNTVGWDSRILKDTDTLNEDVSTATLDAAWVWNALNGENTPDTSLLDSRVVEISYELNRIVRMRERYLELYEVDVLAEIQARTHGVHRTALLCLMGGPYESDARIFDRNDFSFLFDQELMAEALFAKEPDEIRLLASHFFRIHGYSLRSAIEGIFETPIYQRLRTAYYKVDSVRSEAFGRACVRALSADREVESLESLESMTPTEMLIREHQLFDDVEQLYQMDLVLRCRVLDHHLLLELVLTKSKLYLDELCRRFSKQHGIELTDTLSAMGWTAHGTLDVYPPGLVYAIKYTLHGASSFTLRDAQLIDKAMTESVDSRHNHERLVTRIIRAHFGRKLHDVKEVYENHFRRKLEDRIGNSMAGDCGDLMFRLVESCRVGDYV